MDMTALMSQVMESQLAGIMYRNMPAAQPSRYLPSSTRRSFDSQMQADAGTFRQSSQNMKDAMAMVTVAQSGVTTIKNQLTEMYGIATEMATLDNISDEQYASYSRILKEQTDLVTSLAENIEFNGMKLLDGSAGMEGDGVVVLSAGGNPMDQELINLLNGDSDEVLSADGTMNLNALGEEVTIANKDEAQILVDNLNNYISRLSGIEGNYSYDIKSLDNLSVLFENKADIFEGAIQYKPVEEETETPNSFSYLENLLLSQSGNGSIFSRNS